MMYFLKTGDTLIRRFELFYFLAALKHRLHWIMSRRVLTMPTDDSCCLFSPDTCEHTCAEHAFAKHTEKYASEQDDFCYISPRLTQLESLPFFSLDRSSKYLSQPSSLAARAS
jgi:hypothetical protein